MLINVTAMQACDVCACVTLYFQSFKKSAFFFVRIVVLLLHLNQSTATRPIKEDIIDISRLATTKKSRKRSLMFCLLKKTLSSFATSTTTTTTTTTSNHTNTIIKRSFFDVRKFKRNGTKLVKLAVALEVASFVGTFTLWSCMNRSQEFRYFINQNCPSLLDGLVLFVCPFYSTMSSTICITTYNNTINNNKSRLLPNRRNAWLARHARSRSQVLATATTTTTTTTTTRETAVEIVC